MVILLKGFILPIGGDKERGGQTTRGRDDRSQGRINSSWEAPASNLSLLPGYKERGGQLTRGRDDRSQGRINSSREAPASNLSLLPGGGQHSTKKRKQWRFKQR